MKKLLWLLVLVLLPTMMFSACSSSSSDSGVSIPLNAVGGNGTFGTGGAGGQLYTEATGTVTIAASGTVNASFTPSEPVAVSFGTNTLILSAGTTTVVSDATSTLPIGTLCTPNTTTLYLVSDATQSCGAIAADEVTGIWVPAGSTLVLPNNAAARIDLANDMLIEGVVQTQASALGITALNIEVGAGGQVTTSATTANTDAKRLSLSAANKLINRGTIDADGNGTGNGASGIPGMQLTADALLENTGVIEANGGNGATTGGNGGWIYMETSHGNFHSSGRISVNGGTGANGAGGIAGLIDAWTDDNSATANGDVLITGTWEANGGNGTDGDGGTSGMLFAVSGAQGNVLINAAMSARGGDGLSSTVTTAATATHSGGGPIVGWLSGTTHRKIGLSVQSLHTYGTFTVTTPGTIKVAGTFDFRGGNGDLNGGDATWLEAVTRGNAGDTVGADIELVLPFVLADGGIGATIGGSGGAAELYSNAVHTSVPAGAITNQATIQAMGGVATNLTGTGGVGGVVEMIAGDSTDVTVSTITEANNSGTITVSGGNGGAAGGNATGGIYLEGEHAMTSVDIYALGGNGTELGGNGGDIELSSRNAATPSMGSALCHVEGGTGATPGDNGTVTP